MSETRETIKQIDWTPREEGKQDLGLFSCRETRSIKEHQAIFKDVDRRKTGKIQCKETKGEESSVIYRILGESLQIVGSYSICFESHSFIQDFSSPKVINKSVILLTSCSVVYLLKDVYFKANLLNILCSLCVGLVQIQFKSRLPAKL